MYMESSNKFKIGIVALITAGIVGGGSLINIQQEGNLLAGGDVVVKGEPTKDASVLKLETIDAYQTANKTNGKFIETPKTKEGDLEYWVNEYVAPEGAGYETVMIRTELDGSKYIMQTATGPEGKSRSFDWKLIEPNPHGL